jgi:hypothetical protein
MNLKDLSKFDVKELQNIDWGGFKDRLFSQPDFFVNILLALITVSFVFSSSKKLISSSQQLQSQQAQLKIKLDALNQLNATKKTHKEFLEKAPQPVTDDQLIETLSEFAFQRDVQILSFSSPEKKSNNLLVLTSIELKIASEKYENIILFINDIENSSYAMRIGEWSGKLTRQAQISQGRPPRNNLQTTEKEDMTEYIQATVRIESLELKNV